MTEVHFSEPPPPPDGCQWCQWCLMAAKSRITQAHGAEIGRLVADGEKGQRWIPWDNRIALRPGRYRGLSDMPQLGILDLCWDHLAGVRLQRVPAPGLVRGQG